MSSLNLHNRPFDEATLQKLDLFEKYTQKWLPTFLFDVGQRNICIFDFFAGPGYDVNSKPGSPIRILEKLREQTSNIKESGVKVLVYFNELDLLKFESLRASTSDYLDSMPELRENVVVQTLNLDFEECFGRLLPLIERSQSLVFLDQNGIEFSNHLFDLTKFRRTDFMVFVASSYAWRFAEQFRNQLGIDPNELKANPYRAIHRTITHQFRTRIEPGSKYQIYPFSLKKGANIYGVIFGASHPRAVDKFLGLVWQNNPINGEANFDIDDDEAKRQGNLFEPPRLTKIESFQRDVENAVLRGELTNNRELYDFVLRAGHIGKHARDVLVRLKREKRIWFEGNSPCVTYDKTHKSNELRLVEYQVISK